MDKYHQGPYQHMSPSGFPGFLLIALSIGGLWVLLPNHSHCHLAIAKLASTHYDALFNRTATDTACPYCKNHFQPSDLVMLCDKCKSVHHLDCWNANSGYGIFGCDEKKASKIEKFIRN